MTQALKDTLGIAALVVTAGAFLALHSWIYVM